MRTLSSDRTTLPLTEARDQLSGIVKRISELGVEYAITVNGVPAAVMLSVYDYEGLLETLEILSDPDEMAAIAEGNAEIDAGLAVATDPDDLLAQHPAFRA